MRRPATILPLLSIAMLILIWLLWTAVWGQFSGPVNSMSSEQGPAIKRLRPQIENFHRQAGITVDSSGFAVNLLAVGGATDFALDSSHATDEDILHPDWVYIQEGFGGHRWWLVATPLPMSEGVPTNWENPEIFYSDDGWIWTPIAGNPIAAWPGAGYIHADPSLLYENGVLYSCYNEWKTSATVRSRICCRSSANGTTWSAESVVHESATLYDCCSPVVRNWKGTYYLFAVNAITDVAWVRTSSSPSGSWSAATDFVDTGWPVAGGPKHFNFTIIGDQMVCLCHTTSSDRMAVGVSCDGINWSWEKNLSWLGTSGSWNYRAYQFGQPIWHPEQRYFDLVQGGWDGVATDYRVGRSRLYCTDTGIYPQRYAALQRFFTILGDCRLCLPHLSQTGTTLSDISLYANHCTAVSDIGTWDTAPTWTGVYNLLTYNGTDEYATADDDDSLSFGNGAADQAFSLGAWVEVASGTKVRELFSKGDSGGVPLTREYRVNLTAAEQMMIYLYDEDTDGYLTCTTTAVVSNGWHFVVCTYDASGTEAGLDWYVDGLLVANTDAISGAYTSMVNQGDPLYLGARNYDDAPIANYYWSSGMALPFITAKELSAAEVWLLYQAAKQVLGR